MTVAAVTPNRRPVTFGLYLALVMAAGPLMHYALSALGPLLINELDLSATAFGSLWMIIFGVASLLTVASGKLTDRFGPRYLLSGVFIAALSAILIAAGTSSYFFLVLAAGLTGFAQSVSNPATNALVSADITPANRGLVIGIKQSGVQAGQFVAGLALPFMSLLLDWRLALLSLSLIALVGLIVTLRIVPPPALQQGRRFSDNPPARLGTAVRWMTLYAFLMGTITQATNVYLPIYFHQELGASIARAGSVVAVLGGAGIIARLVWGGFARETKNLHASFLGLAILACAAMGTIYFAPQAEEWLAWLGAVLFSFSALAANVVVMLAVVQTVRIEDVGRATGWVSLGMFLGYMVGPPLFGWSVDQLSFRSAWLACVVVAGVLAILTLLWWAHENRIEKFRPAN